MIAMMRIASAIRRLTPEERKEVVQFLGRRARAEFWPFVGRAVLRLLLVVAYLPFIQWEQQASPEALLVCLWVIVAAMFSFELALIWYMAFGSPWKERRYRV